MRSGKSRFDRGIISSQIVFESITAGVRGTRGLCVPTIFLDGVRTAYGQVDTSLDQIAPLENLYAIEVHRGVTGIPIEFGSFNECGVLVFWTLRGRRRG